MHPWRFASLLGGVFVLVSVALAIRPHDRGDWMLENAIAAIFVVARVATARVFPLSRISYSLIFSFLCLHTIGAHYTYSLVPYDAWSEAVTGRTLNSLLGLERNHFDRFVHLCYGLLLAYPIREVFLRIADAKGFWGFFLPVVMTIATSAIYELIEWVAASVLGGDLGMLYLGTQGDAWDAHKDMTLAALGAVIAMAVTGLVASRIQRDFAREWAESLRVKRKAPLGEVAIAEALRDRRP